MVTTNQKTHGLNAYLNFTNQKVKFLVLSSKIFAICNGQLKCLVDILKNVIQPLKSSYFFDFILKVVKLLIAIYYIKNVKKQLQ